MDMHEYNRLSLGEKASLLWQQALFLERHADANTTSSLYHYRNFYIEAVVSHQENKIVEVIPFRIGERLEKYISGINLRDLV